MSSSLYSLSLFSVFAFGFNIFFGWLSDRIGRKPLIVLSFLLAVVCFRPLYEMMYQTANLKHKVENLSAVKIKTKAEPIAIASRDSIITTSSQRFYTDGTSAIEIKKEQNGKVELATTITLNEVDKWELIFILFLLLFIGTISFGPLAAFLVEMFPLKIRYSSMSLPYHIGQGIFGGLCPVIATYMIQKDKLANVSDFYLSGLKYPLAIMALSLVISILYLKENSGVNLFLTSLLSLPTF